MAAEALRGEALELEELNWRGDKERTAKKLEAQQVGRGGGFGGSSTASPMGSLTDEGNDDGDTNAGAAATDAAAAEQGETLGNISGINDDGYFGSASGQWLSLEPDTEITFATGSDKTAWEDLKDCWKLYGLPFATGLCTVVFFTAALIIWSTTSSKLRDDGRMVPGGEQAEGDWAGGASGMAGSEAALTDYQAWPWEVIPAKCAHPEFHRPLRSGGGGGAGGGHKKGRSLLPGLSGLIKSTKVKGAGPPGGGRRSLLELAEAVRSYTEREIELYSGDEISRQKAMDLVFKTRVRCPLQTLSCGVSGAPDLAPKSLGSCAVVGPGIYKGSAMGPSIDQHTTVIRLAGMPTAKSNERALGSKTHVIFATGDQKAPDERFTPRVTPTDSAPPPNALSSAAPHFNPDLLWILEDQRSTLGGTYKLKEHNGRRVMWVNRPYPMSTLANVDDPMRLFDVRLFAARVVGAVFDEEETAGGAKPNGWFDAKGNNRYLAQDHLALLLNVMYSGLCSAVHTYGFTHRPLAEGASVAQGYYEDNAATRAFHELGARNYAHSVRESAVVRALMTRNGTVCSYGA